MTAFETLSGVARAVFALWMLVLCLVNVGNGLLAAVKKRYRFCVFALLLFAPVYLMWQIIFDLSLTGADAVALSRAAGGLPWAVWLAASVLFTGASSLLLIFSIRYDRTFITPGAIKLYLDKIPCGVCCWRDNGRVLFSNVCMNGLCVALSGTNLLNGNQFLDAVRDGILTVDGRVWRFSWRDIVSEGETLHEMIASDITSEYAKTQALERDKAELSELNRELGEYYLSIDDAVRRQETLQAKVNIHDEMNRLMLSTTAASADDAARLDRIFPLWEQNALLLCMEAGGSDDQRVGSIEKLAEALRIKVEWRGELPESLTDERLCLFVSAAKEAVVNAVKHAGANVITFSFEKTGDSVVCRFTNEGKMPSGEVRLTGGLSNLKLLAEKQGAGVSAEAGDVFALTLRIPLGKSSE